MTALIPQKTAADQLPPYWEPARQRELVRLVCALGHERIVQRRFVNDDGYLAATMPIQINGACLGHGSLRCPRAHCIFNRDQIVLAGFSAFCFLLSAFPP